MTNGPFGKNVTFIESVRNCIGQRHTPCHAHCDQVFKDCLVWPTPEEVFDKVDEKLSEIFKDA